MLDCRKSEQKECQILQSRPREGVIIDDRKTTLFNNLVTLDNIILTSQNDVREMDDDDDDPKRMVVTQKRRYKPLK